MIPEDITRFMREREHQWEKQIPGKEWIVVRLDGRGFSTFTEQYYEKPFDLSFHRTMETTAFQLMEEFQGLYTYTASDEFSLLFPPTWGSFDRRVQKIVTLLASSASVRFSTASNRFATFDGRVLTFSTPEEVIWYFSWRLSDAARCALQTTVYWTLRKQARLNAKQATKMLNKTPVSEKLQLLSEYGVEYDSQPLWQRKGIGIFWENYEKEGYNPQTRETVKARRKRLASFEIQPRQYQEWLLKLMLEKK